MLINEATNINDGRSCRSGVRLLRGCLFGGSLLCCWLLDCGLLGSSGLGLGHAARLGLSRHHRWLGINSRCLHRAVSQTRTRRIKGQHTSALRGLLALALGLAAVFFVAAVLGLGAAFFAAGLVAAFCQGISTGQDRSTGSGELTLAAAGLAEAGFAAGLAAAFFRSLTGPEGPEISVSKEVIRGVTW